MAEQTTSVKVPVNSKNLLKVISCKDPMIFEKETNEFLATISGTRQLVSMTILVNNNKLVNALYYREITPMTKEDWEVKQSVQNKFASGYIPEGLTLGEPEVTKL